MKTHFLNTSLFIIVLSIFLLSCDNKNNEQKNTTEDQEGIENQAVEEPEVLEAPIVCLWSKISVREEPKAKGKWKAYIYLGEKATYKGISEKDTTVKNGKSYAKIELADGTTGWVEERFFAIDARPAVIISPTKLYERPDILTAGKKSYDRMQFVVITDEKEGWKKVKAKKVDDSWFSTGWVRDNNITETDIDVSVAVLENRAAAISDSEKKLEALNEIANNPDFGNSIFMEDIQQMILELGAVKEEGGDAVDVLENYGD
ncbi:MAG: hypothetical protein L3J74_10520 [Bacteroidales bacterium]|nr:hypothetical protein [Bacteroidales bacterium]